MTTATTPGPMVRARIAAGLTREQVGHALARGAVTVARWENGATTPPQAVMLRLAALYGCPVSDLVAD